MNGKLCKIFFMILVACVAALPNETFAAPEKFEAVGVYAVGNGEDESPKIAKARTKKEALRIALDKAGLYLQSVSKAVNNKLTKDELQVLAAAVLKVQRENISKKVDGKNIELYWSREIVTKETKNNVSEKVSNNC